MVDTVTFHPVLVDTVYFRREDGAMAALAGTAEKRGPVAAQYGPYALVSGASDGICAAFARELAPKGIVLFVTARREDRLVGLAKELREAHGVTVHVIPLDLADRA